MELIIHIFAILTVVQSTWSSPLTSAAPPIGSQTPGHPIISTTPATEIRTGLPVSSPSQRTISSVDYSTGTTPSSLLEVTKAHSEQNFTKSSSEIVNTTTNLPTRPKTFEPLVSVSSQDETKTTIERTNLGNRSTPSPSNTSQGAVTPSSSEASIPTRVSSSSVPSEEVNQTPSPSNTSQRAVTPSSSEASILTRVSSSSVSSEEVNQTTSEEPSKTPIPGEPGLRSSPRVASEYSVTTIDVMTEGNTSSKSSATNGIAIDTDSSTPMAVLFTTLRKYDTSQDTDTQLPDTTSLDLTTVGKIVTRNPSDMPMTSVQVETTEPSSVYSLVTELPLVTDLPTGLMPTDVSQTMQTSLPSAQSTALSTDEQPLEVSTLFDGGTDGTPSAFDPVSLEATTRLDETFFDTTEAGTLPTTTVSPLEVGSIGTIEAVTDLGMTEETNPATDLQEMETDLLTGEEVEGTPPLELWTIETSSEEVTEFDFPNDLSTELMASTEATTTIETPVIPAPCLCDVESDLLSASVCLCNTSLALSNFTYRAHLVRRNHDNRTHPEVQVHAALISSGSGCWNISVPLGGSYKLVVTAEDGLGNLVSTPTAYFYSGLMPPFLSVKKVPGAIPSLELYWQIPYPTYVDDVTIFVSKDDALATELTWMRVGGVRTSGQFTFVASGLGSKYSVAVVIASGAKSVTSNYDTVVIAPQHPHTVRVASISSELLTMQWPHDPSSCTAACSYLVRYQQTSPYNYNSNPVTELPVRCPGLLAAQPARSTSPNAMNTCTEYLRDLIPGALYDIDVYASSYGVLSVTAAQLRQRTPPTPPQNVTVTNVTEQSITIAWTPGAGYRTRYHLHAYATSYSEEVGVVHGDVTDFTFHNLLAGTRYIITIRASANDTDGDMVPVGETTLPTKPGPVDRLRLEPQIDHRQIRLAFLAPMLPNGVLEGYRVEYVGKRNGSRTCSSGQKYLPVVETSVIIEGLKGGCYYTFTVKARNEVGLGPGASDSVLTAIGIPQVPDARPLPPPSKTIRSRNFVVNFDPSIFDDVNGEITHVIVIVAQSSAADDPARSNSSLPRMPTWAEAISNDVIPPYQISEPLVLSDLVQDTRRKRSVAATTPTTPTITKIDIGTEECSYETKNVYCNGPLIQGRSYVYRFRGISPGGYADTKNSLPVSLPMSPHGVIIGISTALFSLLVVVIILSIVIIVRKFRIQKCLRVVLQCKHRLDGRGRYLPANMKDVELTRVPNNSHHTISKQKHSRPVRLSDFTAIGLA
eukprot:XP_011684052.1 PREDICTED: mucin-17 isoform X1 [Strongylocentrotus purpuratus]